MYTESAEKIGTGCVCLGHALSRHGHVQPTSSTAPMGLQTIERQSCNDPAGRLRVP